MAKASDIKGTPQGKPAESGTGSGAGSYTGVESGTNSGVSPGGKGGWRKAIRGNVLMVGLTSLFTDFSSEMIYPLLPLFISGLVPLGLAPLYIGLLEGLSETTSSLLKIFSGRISDALGKRKALVMAGYGISSIVRPLTALVMAGWQVIGLRFLDRIGKGLRTSPRDALINDAVAPGYRGLAFSFHRSMDHLGAILGPLAAIAILYLFFDYDLSRSGVGLPTSDEMSAMRWLFALALIPGLAAMAVVIFGIKESRPPGRPPDRPEGAGARTGEAGARTGEPGALAEGAGEGGGNGKSCSEPQGRLFSGFKELPRRFYGFVGATTLFALGNSSDLFLVFYGKTLFNLNLIGMIGLWIVLHAAKIIFGIPGGILSDKLGRKRIILTGWLMYALVYLGLAFVNDAWQFWALLVAYGFYYGMTEGAEKALVGDFVPSEKCGTAFGVYHGAIGLAALPASLLFGVFWTVIGPRAAFGIGASLAGAASIFLFIVLSRPAGVRGA